MNLFNVVLPAAGAFLGVQVAKDRPWVGATIGALAGSFVVAGRIAPEVPPDFPPEPAAGLGIWDPKHYYTIWDGKKYLPYRLLTESAAFDWYTQVSMQSWNARLRQYIYKNKRWNLMDSW